MIIIFDKIKSSFMEYYLNQKISDEKKY